MLHINEILIPPKSKSTQLAVPSPFGDLNFKEVTKGPSNNVPLLLKELKETETKTLFEFFEYLKDRYKEKTQELELITEKDRHKVEKGKVRKTILKYISVFHPDK